MIAEKLEGETGAVIDRRQIDVQPVKTLGVHKANVRLTIDLVPEVVLLVHLENEPPESAEAYDELGVSAPAPTEEFAEVVEQVEALEAEEAAAEEAAAEEAAAEAAEAEAVAVEEAEAAAPEAEGDEDEAADE